ncbi:hypothetical protein KY284_012915 [Solanum tuberosum]|nr:hypothetical protein KY284_012915 [Solanum tuberosum]
MKQTYLITENEPSKNSCSTGQTAGKVVEVEKDAKDSDTIVDWKEKDVLLRSWISSTLTENSMEDEEEVPQQNHNMVLSAQKGRGRGNNNINSSETGYKLASQGIGSKNSQYGLDELSQAMTRHHIHTEALTKQVFAGLRGSVEEEGSWRLEQVKGTGPTKLTDEFSALL